MKTCGFKERDEGHYRSKKCEKTEKGIRCWKMGRRVDRVNETAQLKAGKKHPTARSVAQILKN